MKIRLTRGCLVSGFPNAKPGDVLDVPNDVAHTLLAIRKAERVTTTAAKIEVREPAIETRDPEPVPVRRKKA